MRKRLILVAALVIIVSAAIAFLMGGLRGRNSARGPAGFVQADGVRLVVDGKPFRFVGANLDLMFQKETRAHMPNMMRFAAGQGMTVVRVWATGEGGLNDVQPANNWKRDRWFRLKPDEWNEEEFVFLDQVIAEAARNGLRVQLCLANWWRDTGGVTQYLRWAGINGADDDKYPFGINNEKAMLFYTNETTRRLYRAHVEKIVARRNTVTGKLYRDDPAVFGYELINEAQAITGRWPERRSWIAEMSTYLKALDPHHIVAPGDWGYRSAAERREWLLDHQLATIDYCDVHNYPRDDKDVYVDSAEALNHFVEDRAAAAFSIGKPFVLGEFGMLPEGYGGVTREAWFRSYFDTAARNGAAGAMFWILTSAPQRGYSVTYNAPQDAAVLAEVNRGAQTFAAQQDAKPPKQLLEAGRHLVPYQFVFTRSSTDAGLRPQQINRDDGSLLYRFKPEMAVAGRFEKLGDGPGFIWGSGVGFFDYVVPERADRRRVGHLIVRAHLQPVLPVDAALSFVKTRITLFVNGTDCGSRLIPVEDPKQPLIQEWMVDEFTIRLRVASGLPLTIRFAVTVDSDWLYGINIANWPEGYDAHDASPIEVEVR